MTETSFPVVEEPLTADQWSAVTLGIGSGILDTSGGPYYLANFSNANNTVDVTVSQDGIAQAIVAGFYHRMDADVTLSLPAVSSPTTYHIALQYDPLRTSMPVQLGAFTELDRSQGKQYVVLHEIDREPDQLLTDATRRWVRPRVVPTIMVSRPRELPPASSVLWGTVGICHGGSIQQPDIVVAKSASDSEANQWVSLLDLMWEPRVATPTYDTPVAAGHIRAIGRRGQTRRLRGRVALASGLNFVPGRTYGPFSGVLDERDRPTKSEAFFVATSDPIDYCRIEVRPNGEVVAWVSNEVAWIDLAGVEWQIGD